jgi:TIR domain
MIKVFLGWNGDVSHRIALALHEWLPWVIQNIKPWLSSEDIDKGARWGPAIVKELAESKAAIFSITPHSLRSTWMHFEAGATSNTP